MKTPDKSLTEKAKRSYAIVGIGASAGGLEALKKTVKGIPPDSGMAYIILQQLSPGYKSNLTEILSQETDLPVHEIINDISLTPNHIYIIPENNSLIISDGRLKLENTSRNQKKNSAIDIFFQSLAEIYENHAIGIILSGVGFEGTIGLRRIRELGGITITQDPKSAALKGMPQSAIDADAVDYILFPENIPAVLLQIQKNYKANDGFDNEKDFTENEAEILQKIINLVNLRSGHDFHHYRQTTIRRRIARRMVISKKETLQDYHNFLRNDKSEQDFLFNDILIPATYFFRNEKFFESFHNAVSSHLVENAVNKNIRVWVAGCTTGEEAYSIAIILHEYLLKIDNKDITVQILASDISEKCIEKARTAIYSSQDIQQISETRLNTYFTKKDGSYHVNKVIRDMCVFAIHNFIQDPPFSRIDLISCRNVLIYLDPYLQNKAMTIFHYSLKEKGILFLGKNESALDFPDLFEPVSKKENIYTKKNTLSPQSIGTFKTSDGDSLQELQALKEELESNNAELSCLKKELMHRHEHFFSLQNYSESIINTIHEPLLIIDVNFTIKSANPAFYKFFNTTELETEGDNFFAIGDCQWNIPELRQILSEMLTAGIPIKDFKVETLCPGIGKKVIKINAHHVVDAKPSGMILLALEDITDVTSTTDLLKQKNEELQKHNEQLENFSSAASHDLQDPLRKIHMFCNKIIDNDKGLSDSTKHDLERIKFSLNNMSQLITDLIGYSKINSIEKEFKKADMNSLLNKTLRDLKDDISETNAVITVSSLPVLNVIPYQIQQLFANLIMNSIKYSKKDIIPNIVIQGQEPSANEIMELEGDPKVEYAKIKISDNGIGFSQEYEDKIFQPFYRLHSKNNYRGSGLGLALVKKIIVNHKGFIKVSSKVNEGTQFIIYLPSTNHILKEEPDTVFSV